MTTSCIFDEEIKKYARDNLNETEETRLASLDEIRRWLIEEQPKLNARLEDPYLLSFLRGCKFHINKTKKKLINYYMMRKNVPEWFSNRNPELQEIQEIIKMGVFIPLKKVQDNRLVLIIRTSIHDPRIHLQDNVFKAGNMMVDVLSLENIISAQMYGIIAILDMAGTHIGHAKEMTPNMIKKAVNCWQNYHIRPKHLEFINTPLNVNIILSIFKSFMSPKLRERIRVHSSNYSRLYDIISKDILPPEYGGTGETVEELIQYWNSKFLNYSSWFLEDEKYKSE